MKKERILEGVKQEIEYEQYLRERYGYKAWNGKEYGH